MHLYRISLLVIFFTCIHCAGWSQFSRYIVEFKNKNGSAFSVNRPEEFLSQRAIERRIRYNIAIDSTDLPVLARYVDSVRLAGAVTIINTSKWLNQVCIQSVDATALNKIANFPFVKNISEIASRVAPEDAIHKFAVEENSLSMHTDAEDTPSPEL